MMRVLSVPAFACSLVVPSVAIGQTCRATVPVSHASPVYAGGGVGFAENTTSYFGTVGGGGDSGFGVLDVGGSSASDAGLTVNSFDMTVTAGGQLAPRPSRRVIICPTVALGNSFASNLAGSSVDGWNLTIEAGGSVGFVALDTPSLQLVPAIGVFGARDRTRLKDPTGSLVLNDSYAVVRVGVGIITNRRFALSPIVVLPLNSSAPDKTFELRFAVSFPR